MGRGPKHRGLAQKQRCSNWIGRLCCRFLRLFGWSHSCEVETESQRGHLEPFGMAELSRFDQDALWMWTGRYDWTLHKPYNRCLDVPTSSKELLGFHAEAKHCLRGCAGCSIVVLQGDSKRSIAKIAGFPDISIEIRHANCVALWSVYH